MKLLLFTTTAAAVVATVFGQQCRWNGISYDDGESVVDCSAKYDRCDCKCNWRTDKCGWTNCDYCPEGCEKNKCLEPDWGDDDWEQDDDDDWVSYSEYYDSVCRLKNFDDSGEEDKDYYKYTLKFSRCKSKCDEDKYCTGFEHKEEGKRCEIWYTPFRRTAYKKGNKCFIKDGASSFSAEELVGSDENGVFSGNTTLTDDVEIPDSLVGPYSSFDGLGATATDGETSVNGDTTTNGDADASSSEPKTEVPPEAGAGDETSAAFFVDNMATIVIIPFFLLYGLA